MVIRFCWWWFLLRVFFLCWVVFLIRFFLVVWCNVFCILDCFLWCWWWFGICLLLCFDRRRFWSVFWIGFFLLVLFWIFLFVLWVLCVCFLFFVLMCVVFWFWDFCLFELFFCIWYLWGRKTSTLWVSCARRVRLRFKVWCLWIGGMVFVLEWINFLGCVVLCKMFLDMFVLFYCVCCLGFVFFIEWRWRSDLSASSDRLFLWWLCFFFCRVIFVLFCVVWGILKIVCMLFCYWCVGICLFFSWFVGIRIL